MRKRGDACGCIVRFLNYFSWAKISEMKGLQYEDDVCRVEYNEIIKAVAYEVNNGARYKVGECTMALW